MKKLNDIYDDLELTEIVYLEDIFDHLHESEILIIESALRMTHKLPAIFEPNSSSTLNAIKVEQILSSASHMINIILDSKSKRIAHELKSVFDIFFNINDIKSWDRFLLVEQNHKSLKDHNEEVGFWHEDGKDWLERMPTKYKNWHYLSYEQGMAEHSYKVRNLRGGIRWKQQKKFTLSKSQAWA